MEAPRCRLCGNRHYGTCANPRTPAADSKKARRGKKKPAREENAPRIMRPADQLPLEDRITALEQIVDELLAGRRKRSEYMKVYMRDRRARHETG